MSAVSNADVHPKAGHPLRENKWTVARNSKTALKEGRDPDIWSCDEADASTTLTDAFIPFYGFIPSRVLPANLTKLALQIDTELHENNLASFVFFSNPIQWAEVSQESEDVSAEGPRYFALTWNGCVAWAKFRLIVPDGKTEGQLQIDVYSEWVSLRDWLQVLPRTVHQAWPSHVLYQAQRAWWETTGQQFRLLDLPKEILRMIVQGMLGREVCMDGEVSGNHLPSDTSAAKPPAAISWQFGHSYRTGHPEGRYDPTLPADIEPIDISCRFLNRELYHLGMEVLLKDTVKTFRTVQGFGNIIQQPTNYGLQFDHIRILKLNFTNSEYFKFFGVRVPPFNLPSLSTSNPPRATLLPQLPNLKEFTLHFRPWPSPWDDSTIYDYEEFEREDPSMTLIQRTRVPCQRAVIDLIMEYAQRYLKPIHHVSLTGFIKTASRTKWEEILSTPEKAAAYDEDNARQLTCIETQSPYDL